MNELTVDLAVIGAGPAGQKGAIQAAKLGKKVVVIDKDSGLGGACLHTGTIPSKTLRQAILHFTNFIDRSYYGDREKLPEISIHDLMFRLQKVIDHENELIGKHFSKNDIQVLDGIASFSENQSEKKENVLLSVKDENGTLITKVNAQKVLIATGSHPRNPEGIPFGKKSILDTNQLLELDYVPKSMVVLGGGVIGCEYATMFAALGTKVTLVDQADRPLHVLDAEIGTRFGEYISDMGVSMKFRRYVDKIQENEDGLAEVQFDGGEILTSKCLIVALGRVANVDTLSLENVGVQIVGRGHIGVNPLFQTAHPRIYAAGDVIGGASLASTSLEQGRLAVRNAFSLKSRQFPENFPYGIYTIPEVSCIGPTEEKLKEKGIHYAVGRAYYYEIARGPINGDSTGMFKIIFHKETLEILAVHIIGTQATELIHIGQMAMSFNAKLDYFIDHIFNYPTFAEGYRVAAFNGMNKVSKQ